MKRKKLDNPFVYKGYMGPDYFCDRENETKFARSVLDNGGNLTLISQRKIGKTGLIKHLFYQIRQADKEAVCVYVDVMPTRSLQEFVDLLVGALVEEAIVRKKTFLTKVLDKFKAWQPTFSLDPISGTPSVALNSVDFPVEYTLKNVFEHLESLKQRVYVAIDEFQQIAEYPEKGTEALLRSYIQFSSASFIFSGSRQHLMSEMFLSPSRPFYQSTQFLNLHPLNEDVYYEFASRWFTNRGGVLSSDMFHFVFNCFGGCTWYVQLMLNNLYYKKKRVETLPVVQDVIQAVVDAFSPQYESIMSFLTLLQRKLFVSIAQEGKVKNPQNGDFIRKYDLSAPSSVKTALDFLLRKDLVYYEVDGYVIYDRLFNLWLKKEGNKW